MFTEVTLGALVEENPGKLIEWGDVSLWGQNLGTGTTRVNLLSPSMIRFLKTLAASGTGPAEEHEGIRYKFIANKDSGTTTPVSSL